MPSSCEPQPHWNTATTTPYAAPTESRLSTAALTAMTIDRNATVSSISESSDDRQDQPDHPAGDLLGEVDVAGRRADEVGRLAGRLGSTSSRSVVDQVVVCSASSGAVVGTTLITRGRRRTG